jgi:hypothetical protein
MKNRLTPSTKLSLIHNVDNKIHLADLSEFDKYEVDIEFTDQYDPETLCGSELPFVSLKDEIEANSTSERGKKLRNIHGRIPYGTPLYIWESNRESVTQIEYIGQTMSLKLINRFSGHAKAMQILSKYVNNNYVKVYFRLCSRLDISYNKGNVIHRVAIEHFPFDQAKKIVNDIEAFLIFTIKPFFNSQYKDKEKKFIKPFKIVITKNIDIKQIE